MASGIWTWGGFNVDLKVWGITIRGNHRKEVTLWIDGWRKRELKREKREGGYYLKSKRGDPDSGSNMRHNTKFR